MRREERLDLLLEQYKQGSIDPSSLSAEDAERVAAAASLMRLNTLEVPSAFAERIEERLRTRVHTLRLEGIPQKSHSRQRTIGYHTIPLRKYFALASIILLLALVFTGFGVTRVAANSLPGDPLYQVKRLEQQIVVAQTQDQEQKVSLEIAHVSTALADLSAVVQERRSDTDISAALAVVASDTQGSQQAVNVLPAGQARENLVRTLTVTLNAERTALLHLLPSLSWSQHLAFTNQLGRVGEQIPLVTRVTVAWNANHTLILTITGKNFAPGVRPIIAEVSRGIVMQQTSTMLKIVVNAADLPDEHAYSVGVANPDGTVAQIMVSGDHYVPDQRPLDHQRYPGSAHRWGLRPPSD
jgi:hypothetical protein